MADLSFGTAPSNDFTVRPFMEWSPSMANTGNVKGGATVLLKKSLLASAVVSKPCPEPTRTGLVSDILGDVRLREGFFC